MSIKAHKFVQVVCLKVSTEPNPSIQNKHEFRKRELRVNRCGNNSVYILHKAETYIRFS